MKSVWLALAAAASLSASAAVAATNWLTTVDTRGGGHKIGNPAAKVKLTEFVSYTCPHCAHFQEEAGGALDLYVATGKVQVDIRHVLRDPVDLTAAMLANCGSVAKFPRNHKAFMLSHDSWMETARRATAGQKARWNAGTGAARRRAIAADLKFYELMTSRGYERVALDRCLADEALAKRLGDQAAADDAKWSIAGTPSFAVDGAMVGSMGWSSLQRVIDTLLTKKA